MIIATLILLGLCFGSFGNALIWRLHQQSLTKNNRKASDKRLSVSKGRSMCVNCGHTLSALDLIPVLSWLTLKGKCRYCKKDIHWQYPLVELTTATLFVFSYLYWPEVLHGWEIVAFGLWLAILAGFIALTVFDLKWMLLPNKIIFPLYALAGGFVLSRVLVNMTLEPILSSLAGIVVGGGIFYLLFQVSNGKWIGGGDVKLGFLLGALVGGPLPAGAVIFLASLFGTIVSLPLLVSGVAKKETRIPFGPFLIVAGVIVMLFGADLIDWYASYFIDI